ncbi:hypothetical protein NL64_06195 [Pseudomonas fluorescens]|uniref:hypothetical protein n=1 Tax=Pseudomonas fluorescens TaxID=294 RepID=UPI00054BF586|nr:hypothetical protein [Pseudomonas fluorescens]KII34851.1 hypothetical protein NL64_06195 [Pseudomonas fluorescens]
MNYLESLLAETLIAAPGCPETLVERALRVSATEFYRDSESWRVTLDPAPVIKGQRDVELEYPAGTFPVRTFWARLDGKVLEAISERNITDGTGTPRGYAILGASAVAQLDVIPTETYLRNGLVMHVAVAPGNELTELPDELFAMHRNGILFGAQAVLLAMPNVSWGDLQLASVYSSMANAEKAQAMRTSKAQQSPVVRKVRYGGI